MQYKTYIDKFNTIVRGSRANSGSNPIAELVYGKDLVYSRCLLHFDHEPLKKLMDDGFMPQLGKMRHVLKVYNASSVNYPQVHYCETSSINSNTKVRATSFDLIFFLIPKPWDRGKGFDLSEGYFNLLRNTPQINVHSNLYSEDGCNWYQRMDGLPWENEGIYTQDFLSREYDKFSQGEESVIIARQHFDIGNESIEVDITDTVNKFIDGTLPNYGIGIAFSPLLEGSDSVFENYLGLFTDKTNTFFEPHLNTFYDDSVSDDRPNFVIGKRNRLYLYSTIGGKPTDLDNIPSCTVTDSNEDVVLSSLEVKRQFQGVYYVDIALDPKNHEVDTMLYDTWSNISYDGMELPNVELDFTLKAPNLWFNIDGTTHDEPTYTPTIGGISSSEKIHRKGEVRKVTVTAVPQYRSNVGALVDEMYYRIYVMDGESEITVFDFDKVNKSNNENFFYLYCDSLLPQKYYIDIRFKYNGEVRTYKDVIHFEIVNDLDNKYA